MGSGGARDLSTLFGGDNRLGNIPAYTGAWTESRIELVRHFKHWVYIGIDRIATTIARSIPNISFVESALRPSPSASNHSIHGGLDLYTSFARRKSLAPIQAHERLVPCDNDHPLVRLLRDPNDPDTAYDLWYETILFLLLTGNAYWYTPHGDNGFGLPEAIWVIPSHWMWPVMGKDRLIEAYEMRPVEGNFLRQRLPAEQIIHFRRKSPISKIDGYSPFTAGNLWVDTQESIDRTRFFTFKNGAFPGVAVEFDGKYRDPADEDLARIESKFVARYSGETRANKPLFLPPGVTLKKLSVSPHEMAYCESSEQIRDNILALLGIPSVICGISRQMTYGSVLAAQKAYCEFAVNPLAAFLGQTISESLARQFDESLRVWWPNFSPDDPEQTEREIQTDLQFGVRTYNEIRAQRGYTPYACGGDDPVIPLNMQPVGFNTGREYAPLGSDPITFDPEDPRLFLNRTHLLNPSLNGHN